MSAVSSDIHSQPTLRVLRCTPTWTDIFDEGSLKMPGLVVEEGDGHKAAQSSPDHTRVIKGEVLRQALLNAHMYLPEQPDDWACCIDSAASAVALASQACEEKLEIHVQPLRTERAGESPSEWSSSADPSLFRTSKPVRFLVGHWSTPHIELLGDASNDAPSYTFRAVNDSTVQPSELLDMVRSLSRVNFNRELDRQGEWLWSFITAKPSKQELWRWRVTVCAALALQALTVTDLHRLECLNQHQNPGMIHMNHPDGTQYGLSTDLCLGEASSKPDQEEQQ